jgi:hypothetical protein
MDATNLETTSKVFIKNLPRKSKMPTGIQGRRNNNTFCITVFNYNYDLFELVNGAEKSSNFLKYYYHF